MKILKLHINGFGRWLEQEITLEAGFNLIYGPNEAGKSTLLNFLLAMFYGLGDLRGSNLSDRPRERFQPWQGGAYGGTISFAIDKTVYKLERNFGKTKSLDKVKLWDEANGVEMPLKPGLEPGEQLFKMSLSEFRNSVFTGQAATQVANENEMKRRLSATMTGSEALISTGEMQKKLEDIKGDIGGERRSGSLITKLRQAEQRLLDEQETALANHHSIVELSSTIASQERVVQASKAEQARYRLSKEQSQKSAENRSIKDGLAIHEKLASISNQIEAASEALQEGETALNEADLEHIRTLVSSWSSVESSLETAKKLNAENKQNVLTLENGGKTVLRAQSLAQIQEKKLALEKEEQAYQEAVRQAEQAFSERKHHEEQAIAKADLNLVRLQSEHKDKLKELEAVEERKSKIQRLQENHDSSLSRYTQLQDRLKAAQNSTAQFLEEKGKQVAERDKLKESNQKLGRWEDAWDANEKKDKVATASLALGLLLVLVAVIALVFAAKTWPWIVLVLSVLALALALRLKVKLGAERKTLEHDRETIRKNNERLLQINVVLDQHEKQLEWSQSNENQLLLDSQDVMTARQKVEAELASLKVQPHEDFGDSLSILEIQEQFSEQELAATQALAELRENFEKLEFVLPDALTIQKAKLENVAYALRQELGLEGITDPQELESLLAAENEKLGQINHIKGSIAELEKHVNDYSDQRLQIQDDLRKRSFARVNSEDIRLARTDLENLHAQFEALRLLEQENERLSETLTHKLGSMTQAEAVLKLETNRAWLLDRGLSEQILTDEQRREVESELRSLELNIAQYQENLWRNQEQLKALLSKTRMPAQIERELGMNQSAIDEILAEVKSIEQAQTWIKEADQEQRRSFGPAINSKFSEMLTSLSGEDAPKLFLSNDFDIHIEDTETGMTRERDYYSAGKIDQLQLALRLAIIETVYMQDTKLPLVFDDSFVQFDHERMQNALDFLIRLANEEGLQIIFTTCHRSVLDHIQATNAAKVLTLPV